MGASLLILGVFSSIMSFNASQSIAIAVILGRSIGKPISLCSDRIEKLADGDLTTPVPSIKRADEVGQLGQAMDTVVDKLNGMISDIGRILEALFNGDLAVDTEEGRTYYTGDFEKLRIYAWNKFLKKIAYARGHFDSYNKSIYAFIIPYFTK